MGARAAVVVDLFLRSERDPRCGGDRRHGEAPVVRQPFAGGEWVGRALESEVLAKRRALVLGAEDSSLLQLGDDEVDEVAERLGDVGGVSG